MNQADAGVAEQLGESAGAAGEPGASGGGIFGMFGRSNRPTATAKTKATDSQTAESKGFKGLQAFASSEYNIPLEATTAMSKNALKGFLVGLEQRRTAEGQAQDRDLRQRQFDAQQALTAAQLAALDAQARARAKQEVNDRLFSEAIEPTGSLPGVQAFAGLGGPESLAPGTLERFAGQPAQVRQPDREQIVQALIRYGTPSQRAEGAKMLLDLQSQAAEEGPPKVTMLDGMDGNLIPFISWNKGRSGQIDPSYGAGLRSVAQQEAITARGEQRKTLSAGELLKSYEAELKGLDNVMSWMGTTPEQRAAHRVELQSKMEALRGGGAPATKPAAEKPAASGGKDVTEAEYEKLSPGDLYWWKGKQLPKR